MIARLRDVLTLLAIRAQQRRTLIIYLVVGTLFNGYLIALQLAKREFMLVCPFVLSLIVYWVVVLSVFGPNKR